MSARKTSPKCLDCWYRDAAHSSISLLKSISALSSLYEGSQQSLHWKFCAPNSGFGQVSLESKWSALEAAHCREHQSWFSRLPPDAPSPAQKTFKMPWIFKTSQNQACKHPTFPKHESCNQMQTQVVYSIKIKPSFPFAFFSFSSSTPFSACGKIHHLEAVFLWDLTKDHSGVNILPKAKR